jgi:hypothetical protein
MCLGGLFLALLVSGCGSKVSPPPQSAQEGYVVHCSEALPEFTLGPASALNAEQEAALCSCVWQGLGQWERRVAEQIAQGKESEASSMELRAFPSRFGKAIDKCGGVKL